MNYAIQELHSVLSKVTPGDAADKHLIYASALLAELAYYRIPDWERDTARRRALLFSPSAAYRELLRGTATADVVGILRGADLGEVIFAETARIIAIAFRRQDTVYVAMRGTLFLYAYDWRVNLNARPIRDLHWPMDGSFHRGFLLEAERISRILVNEINRTYGDFEHLHICGHSLGGAVAAISEMILERQVRARHSSCVVFGSPRYCSLNSYFRNRDYDPVHVRRGGDLVPTVPPRLLGYSDLLRELDTSGRPYFLNSPYRLSNLYVLPWLWFVSRCAAPHSMERYRFETGTAAGASLAAEALTDSIKLRAGDLE